MPNTWGCLAHRNPPAFGSGVPTSTWVCSIGLPVAASRIRPDISTERRRVTTMSSPAVTCRMMTVVNPVWLTLMRTGSAGASSHRNRPSVSVSRNTPSDRNLRQVSIPTKASAIGLPRESTTRPCERMCGPELDRDRIRIRPHLAHGGRQFRGMPPGLDLEHQPAGSGIREAKMALPVRRRHRGVVQPKHLILVGFHPPHFGALDGLPPFVADLAGDLGPAGHDLHVGEVAERLERSLVRLGGHGGVGRPCLRGWNSSSET